MSPKALLPPPLDAPLGGSANSLGACGHPSMPISSTTQGPSARFRRLRPCG